jgi:hypothetical protein
MRRILTLIRLLVSRRLRFCERCGAFTECNTYKESLEDHYTHVKKHLMPDFIPPQITSRFANQWLCFWCYEKLCKIERVHRGCCDVATKQILRNNAR